MLTIITAGGRWFMYRGEGGTGKTAESLHTKAERQHSGLLQRTRLWSFLELSELRSCSDLTTEIQKHNNFLRLNTIRGVCCVCVHPSQQKTTPEKQVITHREKPCENQQQLRLPMSGQVWTWAGLNRTKQPKQQKKQGLTYRKNKTVKLLLSYLNKR